MISDTKILGVPITLAQNLVCLCHLVACIVVIANTYGHKNSVAGVDISTAPQWVNSTFFTFGIVAAICAGTGILFRIEEHLTMYFIYLLLTVGVEIAWFVVFCAFGTDCRTKHNQDQDRPTVHCGLQNGAFIVWMTLLILLTAVALVVTWQAKRMVRSMKNVEMLPYLKNSLAFDLAQKEQADASKEDLKRILSQKFANKPAFANPSPYQQSRAYGSTPAGPTNIGTMPMAVQSAVPSHFAPVPSNFASVPIAVPAGGYVQSMPVPRHQQFVSAVPSNVLSTSLPAPPMRMHAVA